MATPVLLLVSPRGQSVLRAIFSTEMRELVGNPADPTTISSWTITGATITEIVRVSHLEFELYFAQPLSGSHTVTASAVIEAASGEPLGAPSIHTFTPTSHDLRAKVLWDSPDVVVEFSKVGSATPPVLVDPEGVLPVRLIPLDPFAQPPTITSFAVLGDRITMTTETGLPFGAPYRVEIDRDFIRTTTSDVLPASETTKSFWGHGVLESAQLMAVSATPDEVVVGCTEVLHKRSSDVEGLPPFAGIYSITNGDLGTVVESPSSVRLRFAKASVELGTQTFSVRKVRQQLNGGNSFLESFAGPLTETVTTPSTVITKAGGDTGEVVLSGGTTSLSVASREVSLSLSSVTTSLPTTPQVLFGITLLNTQVSVLVRLVATGTVVASIYNGPLLVATSAPTTLTALSLVISDATADGGYLGVRLNDVVVGAMASDLVGSFSPSMGTTDIALLMGDPALTSAVVSLTFLAADSVVRQSYLTTGLLGMESLEPLPFLAASTSIEVSAGGASPTLPGFKGSGKAAFGVSAEYIAVNGDQAVDAIQIVVALTSLVQIPTFTGTVVLFGQNGSAFDAVAFDETYLQDDKELSIVFLHPQVCVGVTAGVSLVIDGVEYSARVPVNDVAAAANVFMVLQPASWWRPRVDPEGAVKMGPSVVFS